MATKFDAFLRKRSITTIDVARATGYHRNHIARVRRGEAEPTRECMATILRFVRRRTNSPVDISDLFEFEPRRRRAQ